MQTPIRERDSASKIRLDGTARARTESETWHRIQPYFGTAGITRVADVTDLDYVRIPVAMAVRPLSESLAVSQGKGASRILAKISAAMESLETWHAENITLPIQYRSYRWEDLPYDIASDFGSHLCRPMLGDEVIGFYPATGIISGNSTLAPRGLVDISFARCDFRMNPFRETSSGLASGNTAAEAALHGIYEVFERDSSAALGGAAGLRIPIDLQSVDHAYCKALIAQMLDAGWDVELDAIHSRFGVPTFVAAVFSQEYPVECAGAGTHGDWTVAVSRALTEAAQTRLTGISGTRDDLPVFPIWENSQNGRSMRAARELRTVREASERLKFHPIDSENIADDLSEAARRALSVTGSEPIYLDITQPDLREDLAVIKVLVPGAVADRRGGIPGRTSEHTPAS